METFSRGTLEPWFVTGFLDAAGAFTFSRSGKQIGLYFGIKLTDPEMIEALRDFFGVGRVYEVGRARYFRVTKREELLRVVEHFDRYPLRSAKREAFEIWREMVLAKQDFRNPDRAVLTRLAKQLSQSRR